MTEVRTPPRKPDYNILEPTMNPSVPAVSYPFEKKSPEQEKPTPAKVIIENISLLPVTAMLANKMGKNLLIIFVGHQKDQIIHLK